LKGSLILQETLRKPNEIKEGRRILNRMDTRKIRRRFLLFILLLLIENKVLGFIFFLLFLAFNLDKYEYIIIPFWPREDE